MRESITGKMLGGARRINAPNKAQSLCPCAIIGVQKRVWCQVPAHLTTPLCDPRLSYPGWSFNRPRHPCWHPDATIGSVRKAQTATGLSCTLEHGQGSILLQALYAGSHMWCLWLSRPVSNEGSAGWVVSTPQVLATDQCSLCLGMQFRFCGHYGNPLRTVVRGPH